MVAMTAEVAMAAVMAAIDSREAMEETDSRVATVVATAVVATAAVDTEDAAVAMVAVEEVVVEATVAVPA